MKILGIHDIHNASAALMVDGEIVCAIAEERLTYRKNEMGFPANAIKKVLEYANLLPNELDSVVFSTKSIPISYLKSKRELLFSVRDWLTEQELYWKPKLIDKTNDFLAWEKYLSTNTRLNEYDMFYDYSLVNELKSDSQNLEQIRLSALQKYFGIPPSIVEALDHHNCHAAYAYYGSPFGYSDAIVITSDGGGDGRNGCVWIANKKSLNCLESNNVTDLARIYRYITLLLGMKIGEHEYKVMGLAPYASEYEINKAYKYFSELFLIDKGMISYKNRPADLFFHFREKLAECRFDGIAGAVQRLVEEVGQAWVDEVLKQNCADTLLFSGGLSMNVKLNQKLAQLSSVKKIYVVGSGGDDSLSVGACYLKNSVSGNNLNKSVRSLYLGTSPNQDLQEPSSKRIKKVIKNINHSIVVDYLCEGKVLGRFSGRMEFGARSLGNRSIIADPRKIEMIERINKKIKNRDFWMPFAPAIHKDYQHIYINNYKDLLSDHMTFTFDTTEIGSQMLQAAMHQADKTVRAQIVDPIINSDWADLIKAFGDRTGCYALINTSFNLHGYPIVENSYGIDHVLDNSDLDGVIFGNSLYLC